MPNQSMEHLLQNRGKVSRPCTCKLKRLDLAKPIDPRRQGPCTDQLGRFIIPTICHSSHQLHHLSLESSTPPSVTRSIISPRVAINSEGEEHSQALTGTHRHSQALTGTHRHSQALTDLSTASCVTYGSENGGPCKPNKHAMVPAEANNTHVSGEQYACLRRTIRMSQANNTHVSGVVNMYTCVTM
ncbi:hypothetical protein E6O75_ATG04041 [Venturia nashicola]|uniref:Uncharacterized protein n=1 Tax=Venturia nashicola TaxID=86259 RepID=A0A4Z1PH59_9PEZI|nr:hypothetical protein E6O75_ATG04041 [Venturia nashicola]